MKYVPNPRYLKAFRLGVRDGISEPIELTSGITWDEEFFLDADDRNINYDRGVNLGQVIGWFFQPLLWRDGAPQPWR